ncbi:molybdenum cofactor guanylyltransferase [Paenibacillus chartarius]|uniref:Probable molybdenum cofactor guanylyltransferase n=1 Tax=Paenibacillus chartarius TaxID=747481 RepID=A0ABV6DGI6_9BACL
MTASSPDSIPAGVQSLPEQTPPPIHGIVLAGGRSSRMGTDKALLPIGGVPLLQRVVSGMALLCRGVTVIVPASEPDRYAALPLGPEVAFAADRYPDKGPLAGIHAGLLAMPAECDYALVMACDMPVLSEPLLRRMTAALADSPPPEAVLCRGQPMHALYHRRAAGAAERLLAADRLRLSGLAEALRTRYVEPPGGAEAEAELFLNLNTPEELQAYLRKFHTY